MPSLLQRMARTMPPVLLHKIKLAFGDAPCTLQKSAVGEGLAWNGIGALSAIPMFEPHAQLLR